MTSAVKACVDLRSAPPRCVTAHMNFSCRSGVHRNRAFAEAEAAAVAPDDGPGLPGEAVALVEATIQKI